jgi:hypothetical protein
MEHQDLTDSRKDPLCISQLKISSSSLDPLPQANMAEDLTKSRRHSPIKGIAFCFLLPLDIVCLTCVICV